MFSDLTITFFFIDFITDTPEETIGITPPFGFPLSTDKLIQSAIELLSCEPSNNIYAINNRTFNQQPNESQNLKDISNTSLNNSSPEIDVNLDCDSRNSTSPDALDVKLKVDESVDGDISNLSAFDEDEGWQSQGRRSHRRKKKELQSRERSNSKGKKDFAKEPSKQHNNVKRQNPRNSHNRNSIGKTNFVCDTKIASSQSAMKENVEKKDQIDAGLNDPLTVSIKDKDCNGNNSSSAVFSYRDALLKVKPKTGWCIFYHNSVVYNGLYYFCMTLPILQKRVWVHNVFMIYQNNSVLL